MMSSKEISELTEKRHDSVKRTMESLESAGLIRFTQTVENVKTGVATRKVTVYHVNKRDSLVAIGRVDASFMARVFDRWQELEAIYNDPLQQLAHAVLLSKEVTAKKDAGYFIYSKPSRSCHRSKHHPW